MKLLQMGQDKFDCSSSVALVIMLSLQDVLQNNLLNLLNYILAGKNSLKQDANLSLLIIQRAN